MRRSAETTMTHPVRPVDAAQIAQPTYRELTSFVKHPGLANSGLGRAKWPGEWHAM